MALRFRKNDYVQIVAPNGQFRYGYVSKVLDGGWSCTICMDEEGLSKLEFDAIALNGSAPKPYDLTEQEKKVVSLLAAGLSTKKIAENLGISPVTVRAHSRILRLKFHLEDRPQLTTYCRGLIQVME